jgi:3-deoxy-manno-octulosonate cytidylyltransferase (CMP-KDO synthetase)
MKSVIIIPSRYGSTRFPGKPLHIISGKSLLQRVCETATVVANKLKNVEVYVATDDQKIFDHAIKLKMKVILTDPTCPTGSDRVLKAVSFLEEIPDFVINFQGDAALTPPHILEAIIRTAENNGSANIVVTPAVQLSWEKLDQFRERKKNSPFSGTSVVFDSNYFAHWFSKNIIPAIRNEHDLRKISNLSPVYRHIGLYGYSIPMLKKFVATPMSIYEKLESLEQLRFLENNIPIKIAVVEDYIYSSMSGIDSLEDAIAAENLIKQHGELI